MIAQKSTEPDDKEQSQRFIDTARELGADETSESFEKSLNILTQKASDKKKINKDD